MVKLIADETTGKNGTHYMAIEACESQFKADSSAIVT